MSDDVLPLKQGRSLGFGGEVESVNAVQAVLLGCGSRLSTRTAVIKNCRHSLKCQVLEGKIGPFISK